MFAIFALWADFIFLSTFINIPLLYHNTYVASQA